MKIAIFIRFNSQIKIMVYNMYLTIMNGIKSKIMK